MIDTTRCEVLPGAATQSGSDTNRISDSGIASTAPMTPDTRGLMSRYQSLGQNCEFGFVQMHFGAYALDLLGWVGTNYDGLIMGLNVDFFGLFDLQNLLPIGPGLVLDQRYGFKFHTRICIEERNVGYFRFSYKDDSDLRTAHEKEAAKVGYMVRKFLEDLEIGHRIYVFKQAPSLSLEQIMAIQAGLSRRRPQKLLSVSTDTPGLAIDEVRLVAPGVKIAAIGRFSPGSRADLADHDGWEVICRTAALGSWG